MSGSLAVFFVSLVFIPFSVIKRTKTQKVKAIILFQNVSTSFFAPRFVFMLHFSAPLLLIFVRLFFYQWPLQELVAVRGKWTSKINCYFYFSTKRYLFRQLNWILFFSSSFAFFFFFFLLLFSYERETHLHADRSWRL